MEPIKKLINWLWHAMDALMSVAMVIMIVLVFTNVVLRYGFGSGLLASAEISRFLFVWVTMLGAVACMREDSHLSLRILENHVPPAVGRALRRLSAAVIVLCSAMLCLGSVRQTIANWPNASPLSGIPVGVLYLAGAVGGAGIVSIALYRLWRPMDHSDADGEDRP